MAPSSEPSYPTGLVWFRRDLRATDHAALYRALTQCQQVHCVFVFDHEILNPLARTDRRVEFIRESLQELDGVLRTLSAHPRGGLIVLHAVATEAVPALAHSLGAQAVFANHDDEPQALARDSLVRTRLATAGRAFHTFKDHTILERSEVLTQTGNPYSVFTPYKNAWLRQIHSHNYLYVNPRTAQEAGIEDGGWAWVTSAWGELRCMLRYSDAVEPGTVWTWNAIGKGSGAWQLAPAADESRKGFLLNHLITEELPFAGGHISNSDPVTGQAGWYDVRVNLRPAAPEEPAETFPQIATVPSAPGVLGGARKVLAYLVPRKP